MFWNYLASVVFVNKDIMKTTLSTFLTCLTLVILFTNAPSVAQSQELLQEEVGNFQAEVVEVISTDELQVNLNSDPVITQQLQIRFTSGPLAGQERIINSDTFEYEAGESVYVNYRLSPDDTESFYISDRNRLPALGLVVALFAAAVIALGRWQGLRSLISLGFSLLVIFYLLLPLLLEGYNPILVSTLVAGLVLFAAIYFTHGFNRESTVAFGGTMTAVIFTALLGEVFIWLSKLTGFTDDTAVYLRFSGGENLDFTGLLLGSIIIGVLGVLDDIAVTQAAIVTEFYQTELKTNPSKIFKRALRVGQEHVGALVNTLVLAYTASALPLLLLFYGSDSSLASIINRELFATEIIRTAVGSIGLILTVPLVTYLAVKFLKDYQPANRKAHSHSHHD
jgi:uncharacterized membrane protein